MILSPDKNKENNLVEEKAGRAGRGRGGRREAVLMGHCTGAPAAWQIKRADGLPKVDSKGHLEVDGLCVQRLVSATPSPFPTQDKLKFLPISQVKDCFSLME